jgi:hypothetical protein
MFSPSLLGAGLAVAALLPSFENQAPVCIISGGDITVTANGPTVSLQLDGCDSFDPDAGQTLSYQWLGCAGTAFVTPDQCATELVIDVTQLALPFTCGVRLVVGDGQGPDSYSACRIYVTILPPDQPDLDIRPGCCPNDVNVKSCESTPVALVGTAGFDVSKVDKKSLRLERVDGVGDPIWPWKTSLYDVATPFEGEGCDCHKLTKDGLPDLYLKFSTPWMVDEFKLKYLKDKTIVPLVLRGKLASGQSFEVFDCIRVRTCK